MGNPWRDSVRGTGRDDVLSDDGRKVTMEGKKGDDVYLVSNPETTIVEYEGEGTDEVWTDLVWTLGSWVENLRLTGLTDVTGTGNELDNVLLGNGGNNTLFGLDGDDYLDGGDGNDTLHGGNGDDTLVGGAGTDTAVFAGSWTDYEITGEDDVIWVVRAEEHNMLSSIEMLRFRDRDIAADEIGAEGPLAVEDAATGVEDSALTIGVLDNDLGQGISVALANDGAKGAVTINDNGTVTYRPNANATGRDSFTYTIEDIDGATSSTTVAVSLDAVNDAPIAQADSYTIAADETLAVAAAGLLANDSDIDGDSLSVSTTPVQDVTYGSLTLNADGSFTYIPDADFIGEDSFTYELSDGQGGTDTATVTLTATSANDAPVAVDDSFTTTEGTELSGAVLDNDYDVDGDELSVSSYDQTTVKGGTVSMTSDGTFTYTPASGFNGEDSFSYTVDDGKGGSDAATVSLTVESTANSSGTVIDVATAEELMAALEQATGGETIRLAPGDYGLLKLVALYDINPWADYASEVTITSADPTDPGVFSALAFAGVGNITFDGVVFDYDAASGDSKPFEVTHGSHHVTIRNSVFDGDLVDGYGDGHGIWVRESSGITIENNDFFNWGHAGAFHTVSDLQIVNNDIRQLSADGLNFSQIQGALIEGNYIGDFHRSPDSTHHPDMIQFWTANTTEPSTDVVIRGNQLMSGEGYWTQSIFMRNEMVDTGAAGEEMFYRNILIEDNVIWNSHLHGITVGETDGLTIRNNTLLDNEGALGDGGWGSPEIRVSDAATQVTIIDNIAHAVTEAQSGWTVADNLIVQRSFPDDPNYYGDLFVNAMNDRLAGIEDLQALPGGLVEQGGYGAALTRYETSPSDLTALIRVGMATEDPTDFDFSASFTAAPEGMVDATEATFLWDFGDGNTAKGFEVVHDYAKSGSYVVTLEVILDDGSSDQTQMFLDEGAWF